MRQARRGTQWIWVLSIVLLLVLFAPVIAGLGRTTAQASGETVFAVTRVNLVEGSINRLIRFNSNTPGNITVIGRINGVTSPGESIVSIDFRPATGQLFAFSEFSRLYTINTMTAEATRVGEGTIPGQFFGFDFNPVVDRIRIAGNKRQNVRLNPNDGTVVAMDEQLTYAADDPNAGQEPAIGAAAYTPSTPGGTTTSLYVIDFSLDILALQGSPGGSPVSPNTGLLTTVGALGVDSAGGGFDIAPGGQAFAVITPRQSTDTRFYSIDLGTGNATDKGIIGSSGQLQPLERVESMAVPIPAPMQTTPTTGPTTTATTSPTGTPVTGPTTTATTSPTVTAMPSPPQTAPRQRIYGLTSSNRLIQFNSDAPGTILSSTPILGLPAGQSLLGIDFRPRTAQLFGLGSDSRLYIIDPQTGQATVVGTSALDPQLNGMVFGFDFNPAVDRLRIVSDAEQNLRINPDTGAVADTDPNTPGTQPDGPLAYVNGDPNAGSNPMVVGAAYTNNISGTAQTQLFVIDSARDVLALQNPANSGNLTTVGPLGVNATDLLGFDIAQGNTAYTSVATGVTSDLATVDLRTGTVTRVGAIGSGEPVRGLTVAVAPPQPVYAVTMSNKLIQFSSNAPSLITSSLPITGLAAGETIVGLDFRPLDARLFALSSAGQLYNLDQQTGAATRSGAPLNPPLEGTAFGFDFNPVVDRIRIVSNSGQNLRVNPITGEVADNDANTAGVQPDGRLQYASGDAGAGIQPVVVAAGYISNTAGTASTTLFVIDAGRNSLAIQNPPNAGTLRTVGSLNVDADELTGFDVAQNGVAYAGLSAMDGGMSDLVTLDLATGSVARLSTIGGGEPIRALAVPTLQRTFLPLVVRP